MNQGASLFANASHLKDFFKNAIYIVRDFCFVCNECELLRKRI